MILYFLTSSFTYLINVNNQCNLENQNFMMLDPPLVWVSKEIHGKNYPHHYHPSKHPLAKVSLTNDIPWNLLEMLRKKLFLTIQLYDAD